MSGGLFRVLQKTLFDRAATNTVFKKTGKRIENRKLSGISQGRFNVFKHKSEQRDITSAVSVLVDVSSSMTQARMISANTSALALTKALSRLGVKVEVATFGRSDGRGLINGIIKAFDDRYVKDSNFGTISRGGTPTGDSMAKAIEDLLLRSETNKILFVLTDGEPVNANTVRYATSIAQELDIKVIPVGLDVKTVGGFANDDVVFCQDASDIIRAIKDGVQRKLFN
ncbi:VWA domain-containing protein [Colwellia sp. MSW7]|uniref:VWA domain-containing protein n=1 Tax=Colwellia maritima TaxID=2912588 RepID=A0ABS9X6V3_9GAMM|nr:VWA domain-containing protein [Colwellia maritima]MCI2285970.1 VWA domain-containing protein [Colwellia maritima]